MLKSKRDEHEKLNTCCPPARALNLLSGLHHNIFIAFSSENRHTMAAVPLRHYLSRDIEIVPCTNGCRNQEEPAKLWRACVSFLTAFLISTHISSSKVNKVFCCCLTRTREPMMSGSKLMTTSWMGLAKSRQFRCNTDTSSVTCPSIYLQQTHRASQYEATSWQIFS